MPVPFSKRTYLQAHPTAAYIRFGFTNRQAVLVGTDATLLSKHRHHQDFQNAALDCNEPLVTVSTVSKSSMIDLPATAFREGQLLSDPARGASGIELVSV